MTAETNDALHSAPAYVMHEKVPDLSVPGWVEIAGDWRWVGSGRPAYRDAEA